MMNKLEEEILKTLSYFEPMNLEKIFLDMDKEFLAKNSQLTVADLQEQLAILVKQNRVKYKEKMWIKVYPKKSLYHKIKSLLFK